MDQKTTTALIALRRIQRRTELYARTLAQKTDLSVSQLKVMQLLSSFGSATPGELVRLTALSNASITSLVDKLEARKLVARQRDPADGRRVVLLLSDIGEDVLRSAPNPLQDHFELFFSDLPEWERSMIVSALERVADIVDARSEVTDSEPILDVGAFDRAGDS
ncbi:MAG: MarR family winged helix-turn-helix transcriptional regulator [Henriciella sp.]|uniref:MarR family winged helix-turn-helix transcriptional regulator n=1 Tax=Henriciella sp. TaxID=1968823 RepID=UPI0032EC320A